VIVIMRADSTEQDVSGVLNRIAEAGLSGHISKGSERTVIGVVGQVYPELRGMLETLSGVDEVIRISRPFKLSGREFHPRDTVVKVKDTQIGGGTLTIMAGPCSVETEEQTISTARAVKAAGATILRGGAFKPRTSPYSFRGLGIDGLKILDIARQETGLPIITELMSVRDLDDVCEFTDIIQIGARNMQNFILLDEVGKVNKPVMLKRGLSGTIEEWLLAAEYILSKGNTDVILCERGIRTFETYTRNTMDVSAIPMVKRLSHLPIIADPSHGTGKWYLVEPLAMASVAAGADGLLIEVHPNPDHALSDGAQSLTFDNFNKLMGKVGSIANVMGKSMAEPVAV
jgi:3-deoxy-7-phosphoheptulonate synthase